jgi:hypothetical protein
MRLSTIRSSLLERELHYPTTNWTDKQSPWRASIGDNKSFGGVNRTNLGNRKKKKKVLRT